MSARRDVVFLFDVDNTLLTGRGLDRPSGDDDSGLRAKR